MLFNLNNFPEHARTHIVHRCLYADFISVKNLKYTNRDREIP